MRPVIAGFAHACALLGALALLALAAVMLPPAALALPEGRHYEMVSPLYKAGYGVTGIEAVAPDGESVAFASLGGFAGVPSGSPLGGDSYLARRGGGGWATVSLQPPPPGGAVVDFSADFEYVLAAQLLGQNVVDGEFASPEQAFVLRRTGLPEAPGSWEASGGIILKTLDGTPASLIEVAASTDLCHIVIKSSGGPLLPAAVNAEAPLYELARGCGGEPPALRLVALKNNSPATVLGRTCGVDLGASVLYTATGSDASTANAVAAGGSEIFFTTTSLASATVCRASKGDQLFVRLGGARTLEVSRPLDLSKPVGGCVGETGGVSGEVPCAGARERASAYFKGASEDGSRVFFTTAGSLTSEDKDTSTDLYMATIGCLSSEPECEPASREVTSLTQVSHAPTPGEAAEVQGVVALAPDGSRAYFVARGVLGEGANAQGQSPVKGADNLYVYDSVSGRTAFVADLCSAPEASGATQDVRCPRDLGERNDTGLWERGEVQTAGRDGRYLVFSCYARLVAGDTDDAKDVYRYDAATGGLERVSVGEAGYDADGNRNDTANVRGRSGLGNADATIPGGPVSSDDLVLEQQQLASRAVTEDGSRIVFSTAEPLSSGAVNDLASQEALDVYEWHEGEVSLLSGAGSPAHDESPVISPSGRDVFFTTAQGLVPQDSDGLSDVYDARLGGGFEPAPVPPQPCAGDACQGPLTNPAPLLVPGSVSQAPGENLALPPLVSAKPRTTAANCRKGFVKRKGKCVRTPRRARAKKGSRRHG
jgi:hypothetical protein